MLASLKLILEIQELDVQMIRLMRVKKERQKEWHSFESLKSDLTKRNTLKEGEIADLKKNIRLFEGEMKDLAEKMKKLEGQQNAVKKVEEFNALTAEMSQADRERISKEQRLSEMYDRVAAEEDGIKTLQLNLQEADEKGKALTREMQEAIERINEEGRGLKSKRDKLAEEADPEIFTIYERLLRNKRDRVIVPIEERCCTGCHIMVTAQDENLVRKGERIVFCEHCSRVHYWPEHVVAAEGVEVVAAKPRRRRTTKV